MRIELAINFRRRNIDYGYVILRWNNENQRQEKVKHDASEEGNEPQ